jgi:hypothetical protein
MMPASRAASRWKFAVKLLGWRTEWSIPASCMCNQKSRLPMHLARDLDDILKSTTASFVRP